LLGADDPLEWYGLGNSRTWATTSVVGAVRMTCSSFPGSQARFALACALLGSLPYLHHVHPCLASILPAPRTASTTALTMGIETNPALWRLLAVPHAEGRALVASNPAMSLALCAQQLTRCVLKAIEVSVIGVAIACRALAASIWGMVCAATGRGSQQSAESGRTARKHEH
jgi:hypothetical protein